MSKGEIQRYNVCDRQLTPTTSGILTLYDDAVAHEAAALEAQAEEHAKERQKALSKIALQQEEYWSGECARIRSEHAAEMEAMRNKHAQIVTAMQFEHAADLKALRRELAPRDPVLFTYKQPGPHDALAKSSEKVTIHSDFELSFLRICEIAEECGVQLHITHSVRRLNQKLQDKVVEEAERSNHHAGSAIDANPVYEGVWYTNAMMGDWDGLPDPVAYFLSAVADDPDLRWGGAFDVNKDCVHIDDDLARRDPDEWLRRVEAIREENADE